MQVAATSFSRTASAEVWPRAGISSCATSVSPHTEHFLPSVSPASVQVAVLPLTISSVCPVAATGLFLVEAQTEQICGCTPSLPQVAVHSPLSTQICCPVAETGLFLVELHTEQICGCTPSLPQVAVHSPLSTQLCPVAETGLFLVEPQRVQVCGW